MTEEGGGGSFKHKWGVHKVKELYDAQSGNFRQDVIESALAHYSEGELIAGDGLRSLWEEWIPKGTVPDAYRIDDEKKHIDIYEVVVTSDISDKKCFKYHQVAMAVDEQYWTVKVHICHWMGNIIASDNPYGWGMLDID